MKKRIIAAMLLAASLCAAVSCGETGAGKKDPAKPQDPENKTSETASASVPENAETVLNQFSRPDYGGAPIRILTSNNINDSLTVLTAPDETLAGERINEALFERDRRLEDYFHTEIDYVMAGQDNELADVFQKSTLASDTRFDFMIGAVREAALPCFNAGLCANLAELPEIDLSKPWWSGYIMENFVINGNFYMLAGEFSPRNVMSGNLLIFNMREFRDRSLPSLYDMVDNGTWTMDAFESIIRDSAADLDGDGKIRPVKDFFGMNCDSTTPLSFYFGMGEKLLCIRDGTFAEGLTEDRALTVFERIEAMYASGNLDKEAYKRDTYMPNKTFMENKALFNCMVAIDLTMFRESETDYGIVPLPKYDEAQKDYISAANTAALTALEVPAAISAERFAALGPFIGGMTALSHYISIPEAYETTLLQKLTRDEDSVRMLRIVSEGLMLDFGYIYNFGDMNKKLISNIEANLPIVSAIESIHGKITSGCEELLELFNEK